MTFYERKQGKCASFYEKLLFLDIYPKPFYFLMPDSQPRYRSLLGSVLSVCTVLAIFSYAAFKLHRLMRLVDYQVNIVNEDHYYDSSFTFSQAEGFSVAAAVTAFDGEEEPIEEPSIGQVKFYLKHWGLSEEDRGLYFKEVKTRPCEDKDFAFKDREHNHNESADPLFFPVTDVSARDLHIYSKKMKCLDTSEVTIQGSYNADKASNLMVVFERCREGGPVTCSDNHEIDAWLENKYLVTLENVQVFIANAFEGDRIASQSQIQWHALSSQIRTDYAKSVQLADLELSDSPLSASLVTDSVIVFKILHELTRVMPYGNSFQTAVTYELSHTRNVYFRQVYGMLDWLRDIGGLFGALSGISGALVLAFQFQGGYMFVMSELFSAPQEPGVINRQKSGDFVSNDSRRQEAVRNTRMRNNMQWNCCRVTLSNIQLAFPRRFLCCCLSMKPRDRIFVRGFTKLEKEIHVTRILKQIRVLKGIVKQGMHATQWQQAYVKYSLKSLDVNTETEEDFASSLCRSEAGSGRFSLRRIRTKDAFPQEQQSAGPTGQLRSEMIGPNDLMQTEQQPTRNNTAGTPSPMPKILINDAEYQLQEASKSAPPNCDVMETEERPRQQRAVKPTIQRNIESFDASHQQAEIEQEPAADTLQKKDGINDSRQSQNENVQDGEDNWT